MGIGGTSIDPELARLFRLPVDTGVLVERVGANTPASRAGLRGGTTDVIVEGQSYLLGGDVIVALDGTRVASLEDLRELISAHKPGDTVRVGIYRDSKRRTIDVELGRQPPTPG
jgi:S1-C subfamily serine protease